jgi:uncharacterized membrane protein YeaQ/YmgE (transglycosylase-associated protein family)
VAKRTTPPADHQVAEKRLAKRFRTKVFSGQKLGYSQFTPAAVRVKEVQLILSLEIFREGLMDILSIIISLVSGAIGGNVAGAMLKDHDLGTVGNSIAGILGGGLGGAVLQAIGISSGSGGVDVGSLIGQFVGGGIGGGILMVIVGMIRGAMAKS